MSVKTIEEYTSTLDGKAKLNLENFIKFMESFYQISDQRYPSPCQCGLTEQG